MRLRLSKYHLPAEEVRRIRRSLGETQAEFAKRLCVDAVTVARWETDQRKCTGLYAKTIAELDKKNSLLTKERAEMEGKQEPIRTIGLHELYGLLHELKPVIQFIYKEVPLKHRREILECYLDFFKNGYYRFNVFFAELCNENLFLGIRYFCVIALTAGDDFFHSISSTEYQTEYQDEKLTNAYNRIYEAVKELAPNSKTANPEFLFQSGDIDIMFREIKNAIDDLLNQPNLKEGDMALLKLYRNLVQFNEDERSAEKFLPIPATVSFSFARFMSVCIEKPSRILVPEFDDCTQLKSLREYLAIT